MEKRTKALVIIMVTIMAWLVFMFLTNQTLHDRVTHTPYDLVETSPGSGLYTQRGVQPSRTVPVTTAPVEWVLSDFPPGQWVSVATNTNPDQLRLDFWIRTEGEAVTNRVMLDKDPNRVFSFLSSRSKATKRLVNLSNPSKYSNFEMGDRFTNVSVLLETGQSHGITVRCRLGPPQ